MLHDVDPGLVTWYIEARPSDLPRVPARSGSGVAVLLRRDDVTRAFLLTAAHSLRNDQGVLLGEILCWRPGTGYAMPDEYRDRTSGSSPGAMSARVRSLPPLGAASIPSGDWALLDVADETFQSCAVVHHWAAARGRRALQIAGYPGRGQFPNRVVEPLVVRDFRGDRSGGAGTLRLNGPAELAKGMSGGGVFDDDGGLVGLHRGYEPAALACEAVSSAAIRARLVADGWEVVSPTREPWRANASLGSSLGACLAITAVIGLLLRWATEWRVGLPIALGATTLLALWALIAEVRPLRLPTLPAVRRRARTVQSIALIAIGLLLLPSARATLGGSPRGDLVEHYLAYVAATGTLEECMNEQCILRYAVGGRFRAGGDGPAIYRDRVKTAGAVVSLVTSPAYRITNPAQYPMNPTYLEFAIPGTTSVVEPRAELVLRKRLTPDSGKIGFYFPYRTRGAVLMVDLTRLGFAPAKQITATQEVMTSDGITDLGDPVALATFQSGRFLVVTLRELAPRTSVIVSW